MSNFKTSRSQLHKSDVYRPLSLELLDEGNRSSGSTLQSAGPPGCNERNSGPHRKKVVNDLVLKKTLLKVCILFEHVPVWISAISPINFTEIQLP